MSEATKPKSLYYQSKDHNHQGEVIENSAHNTPERNMWIAVIIVFLNDLSNVIDKNPSNFREYEIKQLRYQLQHQWMKDVCEFAGLNYYVFKNYCTKVIRKEIQTPKINMV